jgi:tripartite-type tricarboxylate transporter receptor subunit TctC
MSDTLTRRLFTRLGLGAAAGIFTATSLRAQNSQVAPFKQITIYLSVSPGGSFDLYARLLSRHMGKYLPGNPAIVVSHMPGSGGLNMTNRLYNVAAKDGTELGMPERTLPTEPILRKKSLAKFEADKFNWIGSMNKEVGVLQFWQATPTTLEDVLSGKPYPVGATGATSDSATFYRVINELLGANLQTIPAYPGAIETLTAMERGELAGSAAVSWATLSKARPDWVKTGKTKILMQMTLHRSPLLPDVPTIKELVKSELDKQVIDLILSCQDLGRPLVAPPGVPAERVEALRAAFTATLKDPEAIADAKRIKLDLDYIEGAQAQDMIARMVATPKHVVDRAREIYAD